MSQTQLTHEDCLDHGGKTPCNGQVEYRTALSATGKSFPRCEAHWDARLEEQERINRTYPDSPSPPAWFDEADAGEHWDEDY